MHPYFVMGAPRMTETYERAVAARRATYDVEELAKLDEAVLEERMAAAAGRIKERIARVQDEHRDLNSSEQWLSYDDKDEVSAIQDALRLQQRDAAEGQRQVEQRERNDAVQAELTKMRNAAAAAGGVEVRGLPSSLWVSHEHLRRHADAMRDGHSWGVVEERATVTVAGDLGSEASWAAPSVPGPITLRQFAGIPGRDLTGATASMPSLTLPAGTAGVGESVAHGEYDAIDRVNLTTVRHGRWTKVTSFGDAFDDLTAINRAHGLAIARDLDLADITAIQAAAGTPISFSASLLDQNVRQAVLTVAAATLTPPSECVLVGTPANLALVTGFAPASGEDRGSVTTRIFGARVYPTTATVTAGFVIVFSPSGFLGFSDRTRSASRVDPTDGSVQFGSWIHATPVGVGIVGSAASVDVVTP